MRIRFDSAVSGSDGAEPLTSLARKPGPARLNARRRRCAEPPCDDPRTVSGRPSSTPYGPRRPRAPAAPVVRFRGAARSSGRSSRRRRRHVSRFPAPCLLPVRASSPNATHPCVSAVDSPERRRRCGLAPSAGGRRLVGPAGSPQPEPPHEPAGTRRPSDEPAPPRRKMAPPHGRGGLLACRRESVPSAGSAPGAGPSRSRARRPLPRGRARRN